jgi:hypothetical protein
MPSLQPECRPLLIGSLPLADHQEATDLIFRTTPEIPLWPQLPRYRREGMLRQYAAGMPGLVEEKGRLYVDSGSATFAEELLAFYEEYLQVTEGGAPLAQSRFVLSREDAPGLYAFLAAAAKRRGQFLALKGQSTGPVTFTTGLVDQEGRAIFYHDELRDAAVKLLALKARWQAGMMAAITPRPILFFDEPGLAGLGSSAFITITPEAIIACLAEVFAGVRAEQGLSGVHVCANTEWPVLFAAGVDVVSFDAYAFFDRLILYREELRQFFVAGGILASGIVPTDPARIDTESVDTLVERWLGQYRQLEAIGIPGEAVYRQSLITPSCGTGALSPSQAGRVLELTQGVSAKIRALFA